MARMFIRVSPGDYDKFLKSLDDPETQKIARCLTGDDARKGGVGYMDFLLQSADHQFNEKVQICETLSDNYVAFFFGHQAPMFTYQGTLYNTYQDDWTMRMLRIFRDLGRGTQLARRQQILYLKYDSVIVQGAMLNFRYVLRGGHEMATNFDFSLLVKKVSIIYGGLGAPTNLRSMGVKQFAPVGYHTEDPGTGADATNSYVGSTADSVPSGTQDYDTGGVSSKYAGAEHFDSLSGSILLQEQLESVGGGRTTLDPEIMPKSPPFNPAFGTPASPPQPHQHSSAGPTQPLWPS